MANKAIFNMNLNSDQVLDYYKGRKNAVRTFTQDGQSISIPFNILLDYVTHDGIFGTFEIHFKSNGKFQKLVKLK